MHQNSHFNQLQQYARLLIEVGLQLQKGQTLLLQCPVECAYFARLCATAAYDVGAKEVVLDWSDDALTREKYLRAEDAVFDTFPSWRTAFFNEHADIGAAKLNIYATDPELLAGVDADRIRRASIASGTALANYSTRMMQDEFQWCVAAVPTAAWARKVFPDKSEPDAMTALWDAIYAAVHVHDGQDAVALWQAHLSQLDVRKEKLNALRFHTLRYRNSLGTDLTIELPTQHRWEGGAELSRSGISFCANMPTEELFTAPLKTGVNGVAVASMPLVLHGTIVDQFRIWFEKGRIVKVQAEQGRQVLEDAISVDEGSHYLGEVALVPYDSPISNRKTLFYNTLFDENASCHLAFGEAYPCLIDGGKMTREEVLAHGINDSITHVDFMIGTEDLSIVGTTMDGKETAVFENGNFAL